MSPPIYTPDGSEVSEIVLPDGSTASQVIGPDGNVVFEAGGDIPDSGVARYEFEQDVTDSWGTFDGTDNTSAGYVTGQVGSFAKDLDGTDDYVDFGYHPEFTPEQVSIAWWGNYDRVDGTRQYWGIDDSTAGRYWNFGMGAISDGELVFDIVESDLNGISASGFVVDTWFHIVGTWDNSTGDAKLYVDGSLASTGSGTTVTFDGSAPLNVGRRSFSGEEDYSDYQVDDIRIYNKVLSDSEVSNLHSTGSING